MGGSLLEAGYLACLLHRDLISCVCLDTLIDASLPLQQAVVDQQPTKRGMINEMALQALVNLALGIGNTHVKLGCQPLQHELEFRWLHGQLNQLIPMDKSCQYRRRRRRRRGSWVRCKQLAFPLVQRRHMQTVGGLASFPTAGDEPDILKQLYMTHHARLLKSGVRPQCHHGLGLLGEESYEPQPFLVQQGLTEYLQRVVPLVARYSVCRIWHMICLAHRYTSTPFKNSHPYLIRCH